MSAERSTVEVLRAARERISDPERWTRGVLARNRCGDEVGPGSPDAVCWCALGALRAEGRGIEDPATALLEETLGYEIPALNDGEFGDAYDDDGICRIPRPAPARHRRVLALFDKAIERAEAI